MPERARKLIRFPHIDHSDSLPTIHPALQFVRLYPSRGIIPERLQQHAMQAEFAWVPELFDADRHALVAGRRLRTVRAEETIPPGQIETEVAVRFARNNRMVHAVHL